MMIYILLLLLAKTHCFCAILEPFSFLYLIQDVWEALGNSERQLRKVESLVLRHPSERTPGMPSCAAFVERIYA